MPLSVLDVVTGLDHELLERLDRGARHDLGNLLTCVGMSAGALRQVLEELAGVVPAEASARLDEARSLAGQLEYAGRLAVHLVRERPQLRTGEWLGDRSDRRLSAVLDRTAAWIRPLAATRARVVVRCSPALPPVVGTEEELYRVLLNLAVNAVEAIDEGQPDRNEILMSADVAGPVVRIEVRDTGRGLTPAHRDRVYEEGFTTSSRPGAGHGLTVTRGIVERLGGRITLVPGPGAGVLATVELPLASSGSAPSA